jgi:hypothetical protein
MGRLLGQIAKKEPITLLRCGALRTYDYGNGLTHLHAESMYGFPDPEFFCKTKLPLARDALEALEA